MFSKHLKEWIYKTVKDDYFGDIYRDIDLFEKSITLKAVDETLEGINTLFPEVLEEMSNAPSIDFLKERMDRFIKVEPFLRHLLGIFYPNRYKMPPREEKNGSNTSVWTLAPLLKQAFEIIPPNYNLSTEKPDNISFPYKQHYNLVYSTRNHSAHDFMNLSQRKIFDIITACLIVYLDVSGRLCFQIEESFSKENIISGFSAKQYCRNIIHNHNQKTANGFTYVDIKWKANNNIAEYSTIETIMNENSCQLVKILGEAGCGKTTIMRQMVYISAKTYIDGASSAIPVFIQLGKVEIDSSLRADIKSMICNELGIPMNLLIEMLLLNTIRLYLDGFNEILDLKLKKQIAWSIDELSRQYTNLTIFLSDRSLVQSSIQAMRNALVYRLYPLDNNMKETFIKNNCLDQNAKKLLLNHFISNPNYYENFNTPMELKQLIELTTCYQTIPYDFCGEYIRFLFNREMIDKKDENVEYLETFACAIAIYKSNKLSEYEAEACIAKCKQALGYTIPDSRKCLRLLIEMGILIIEDGFIEFKYSSYHDYFWMTAFDKHLEELLG